MKKTFLFLCAAALCLSCTDMVKDELAYMDKRIDDIDPTVEVTVLQAEVEALQQQQDQFTTDINKLNTELQQLDARESENIQAVQLQLDAVAEQNEILAGKIDDLKDYVDDENAKLQDAIDINLERLKNFQDSVNIKFDEIDGDIAEIKDMLEGIDKDWFKTVRHDLDTLNIRMTVAEDSILTFSGRFTDITTNIDALGTSVAQLQADVYNEDGVVGLLTARVKVVEDSVQAFSGKIESLDGSVTSLITLTDQIKGSVDTLKGQIVTVKGSIDSLGGVIDNQILRIDSVSTATKNIDTRLIAAEEKLNGLSASFDTLKGRVDTIEEETIPALTSRIENLEARDSIVRDSLRILDGTDKALDSRLTEIESHNLAARVDTLEWDLDSLTKRVSALEGKFGGIVGIVPDKTEVTLVVGESTSISYLATYNDDEKVSVSVASTGGLVALVTQPDDSKAGTITILQTAKTDEYNDRYVTVFLNSDKGTTAVAAITVHPDLVCSEKLAYCSGEAQTIDTLISYDGEAWFEKESWVSVSTYAAGEKYKVTVTANEGAGANARMSKIIVHPGTSAEARPAVEIIYLFQGVKNAEMKLEVYAVKGTDVYLPLFGNVDCVVVWEDGGSPETFKGEYAAGEGPVHSYSSTGTKTVTISGLVDGLCSVNMPNAGAIRKVTQWGKLGLKSLYGAFYGCAALSSVPADTDGSFKDVEYAGYAFANCKALTSVPAGLLTYCTNVKEFDNTFAGSGLTSIPDGLFSTSQAEAYTGTFFGCLGLTGIPETLFPAAAGKYAKSFCRTFAKCENVASIPAALFANCANATVFEETFYFCKSITELPAALFSACPKATTFAGCFTNCSKLETVPASLFDSNKNVTDFSRTFYVCDKIKSDCESPATGGVHLYERSAHLDTYAPVAKFDKCFGYATFSDKNTIPAEWK